MTAVRPSARFSVTRKWTKPRLTRRTCRKVSVVAASEVVDDVNEQSKKDSVDVGFCGEPFADHGELLSSLSPLLFSMKLIGLYFDREGRCRRLTDDAESSPATTSSCTSSTCLRVYATAVLIFVWLNAFRLVFLFTDSDHFGSVLLLKIAVFAWFILVAIIMTAYYIASHTGQLLKVLLTLPVTSDCVRRTHRAVVFLTAFAWIEVIANGIASSLFFYITHGEFDFNFAPFNTYIKVPEDRTLILRLIGNVVYFFAIPCSLFPQLMTNVLVYIFHNQFRTLKKNFSRALGKGGKLSVDFSVFRRRH